MSIEQAEVGGGAGEIELAAPAEAAAAPVVVPPVVEVLPAGKGKKVKGGAAVAEEPMWPEPEGAGRRGWVVGLVLMVVVAMYGWAVMRFYAGAQGGVDQSGYLMTARLIAGDRNLYSPAGPAKYEAATLPAAAAAGAATQMAVEHPAPARVQTAGMFDWLRNRLSFVPETPFQFASRMCIITEPYGPADAGKPAEYRVYAKYPFGYPLMAAVGRWVWGLDGMYLVDPLCTILACYFAYFLFRQAVSPFMSLLGVAWVACNPLVIFYANDANSHSPTLFCIIVGFWGLLSWMKTKATWRAWVGGLALGYACTIRYTEFLMVLPVLFAAVVNLRWDRKRIWGSLSLVAGWAIPVGVLAVVCWVSFGAPWKTGYSYCKESTGFAWKYLSGDFGEAGHKTGNWETLVTQLNHTGLFVLWPFALAGLFAMMGSSWKLGVTVALWVVPQTVLYMLYYWAPQGETTVAYLRFFMTVIPGMIFAGLWVLERGMLHLRGERRAALIGVTAFGVLVLVAGGLVANGEALKGGLPLVGQVFGSLWHTMVGSWIGFLWTGLVVGLVAGIWVMEREQVERKVGMALGAGVITALGCGMNVYNIMPRVEQTYTQAVDMRDTVDHVRALLPRGAVLFGDDSMLNQMDCVGGWKLMNSRMFTQAMFTDSKRRLDMLDKDKDQEDDPDPIQQNRSRFYEELLGKQLASGVWVAKSPEELTKEENKVIDAGFLEGRRVAFLTVEREARPGRPGRLVIPARADCVVKELGRWVNLPPVTVAGAVMGGRPGGGGRQFRGMQGAGAAPPRVSPTGYVVLYELVKGPAKVEVKKGPEAKGAERPAGRRRRGVFDF